MQTEKSDEYMIRITDKLGIFQSYYHFPTKTATIGIKDKPTIEDFELVMRHEVGHGKLYDNFPPKMWQNELLREKNAWKLALEEIHLTKHGLELIQYCMNSYIETVIQKQEKTVWAKIKRFVGLE